MSDRMQTVLKWVYRLLWLIVGGGSAVAGYGVIQAARVAAAPESFAGIENIGWIADLIGGGGLTAAIAGGVRWLIGLVWGKVTKGKAQPFAQYMAATGAVDILKRYLGEHPAASGLASIDEACGEVLKTALRPTVVVAK